MATSYLNLVGFKTYASAFPEKDHEPDLQVLYANLIELEKSGIELNEAQLNALREIFEELPAEAIKQMITFMDSLKAGSANSAAASEEKKPATFAEAVIKHLPEESQQKHAQLMEDLKKCDATTQKKVQDFLDGESEADPAGLEAALTKAITYVKRMTSAESAKSEPSQARPVSKAFARGKRSPIHLVAGLWSKMPIGVRIGLMVAPVVLVLALVALGMFGKNSEPEFTPVTLPTPTFAPTVITDDRSAPAAPKALDEAAKKLEGETWFNEKSPSEAEATTKQPMFRLPESLPAMVNDPDWSMFLWLLIPAIVIWKAVAERRAEQQRSDIGLMTAGYVIFAVTLFLDLEIATMIVRRAAWFVGSPVDWDVIMIKSLVDTTAVAVSVALFLAAALSIRKDLTPLSTGLFVEGMLFILANPNPGNPLFTLGVVLVVMAIAIQLREIYSQEGSASAISVAVVGLLLFLLLKVAFSFLLGLIALLPPPGADQAQVISEAMRSALAWIFANRGIMAAGISLLITNAAAHGLASALLDRALEAIEQDEGNLVGRLLPTEETPKWDSVILFWMLLVPVWLIFGHL